MADGKWNMEKCSVIRHNLTIMGIFGKEEPEVVEVMAKPLSCQICSHNLFYTRKAVLPGAVATFLNLDWTAPSCTCVICSECGYVHWFFPA